MRQEGEDDESRQFRQSLSELRSGTVTRESWKLLRSRTRNSVSRDEAELFNDIFNEISRFNDFRTADPGDFVWAGEHKVPIQGYGNVDIMVKAPNKHPIRLFNTNELANNVNRSRLRDLGKPVTTVGAENTGREAHKASHEDNENLYQTVLDTTECSLYHVSQY
jgi:hypothetical protein